MEAISAADWLQLLDYDAENVVWVVRGSVF